MSILLLAAAVAVVSLSKVDASSEGAAPQIVRSTPGNGATIPPGPFVLSVTFDRPMRTDSYSFATGPEPSFPRCQKGVAVSADARTFSMRCTAIAGARYTVLANYGGFMNFRSASGVAARPERIAFTVSR